MGSIVGCVLCRISMIKYPRNVWGSLSCDDHVFVVGCKVFCFRILALVKCLGNNLWYLLRGTVLKSAPGSTLMERGLLL